MKNILLFCVLFLLSCGEKPTYGTGNPFTVGSPNKKDISIVQDSCNILFLLSKKDTFILDNRQLIVIEGEDSDNLSDGRYNHSIGNGNELTGIGTANDWGHVMPYSGEIIKVTIGNRTTANEDSEFQITVNETLVGSILSLPSNTGSHIWNTSISLSVGDVVNFFTIDGNNITDSVVNIYIKTCCYEDALLCDEDLPSELTVIRPDDTPNNGWNNENLETGNQLSDDVEMCFTISASTGNTPQMLGLDSDDPNAAFNTLDYSFYVYTANSNNLLRIYENGANVANLAAWAIGDELCIRRNNGIVTYYVNGSLVHTSATTSTAPLQVGSSFYFANGFWGNGTISFSDIAFCQVNPSNEMRVAKRLSQPDSIELAASDPELLEIWNTLTLTIEHYPILQGYEVTEKDLIKYIKKNQ